MNLLMRIFMLTLQIRNAEMFYCNIFQNKTLKSSRQESRLFVKTMLYQVFIRFIFSVGDGHTQALVPFYFAEDALTPPAHLDLYFSLKLLLRNH